MAENRESPTAVVDADAEMIEADADADVDAVAVATSGGKKSKAPPGGKNLLWKKLATETEEGAVKGLDSWPLEGWSVSKHSKKDSFYFMCVPSRSREAATTAAATTQPSPHHRHRRRRHHRHRRRRRRRCHRRRRQVVRTRRDQAA